MLRYILASGVRDRLRFTVTPTGNRTLTLQDFTPPIACAVDWGDGARSVLTSAAPLSHTYADGTPRVVEISGLLGGFWNAAARAAGTTFVTSVDELASRSLVTLAETFRQCTALATIPATVDAPNLAACDRCFSHCRSITSGLPALWLTHPAATHANCFTNCFLSCWGKLGSGCTYRQYVAAVAAQTYYQKYGTGCSARSYVSGTAARTYWQAYGGFNGCPAIHKMKAADALVQQKIPRCAVCDGYVFNSNRWQYCLCRHGSSTPQKVTVCPLSVYFCTASSASGLTGCGSGCRRVYSAGTSGYYRCKVSSSSGVSRCGSGCRRTYTSGQSAYYRCTRSGTCSAASCPWAYANQTACDNAKNAGWA